MGPDLSAASPSPGTTNTNRVIWVTGEFFGVQRARDMLYQCSLNKVLSPLSHPLSQIVTFYSEQVCYLKGYSDLAAQVGLDGHGPR